MKKIKIGLLSISLMLSVNALADNNSAEMKVNAEVVSGCLVYMPSIHLGNIIHIKNEGSDNNETRVNHYLEVTCSKGVPYVLKGQHAHLFDYARENLLTYRAWLLPIYKVDNPREDEFVGYRINYYDKNSNLVSLGDGVKNDFGSSGTPINGMGTGSVEKRDLVIRVWTYRYITPGNYAGTFTATLEY